MNIKLTKEDYIGIAVLVIFLILVAIPVYTPKGNCEVAKAGYTCNSLKESMVEQCVFWGKFKCVHCEKNDWNTCADPSLPDVEWYIGNLCKLHNDYHSEKLDCSNLKLACNQATGNTTCAV